MPVLPSRKRLARVAKTHCFALLLLFMFLLVAIALPNVSRAKLQSSSALVAQSSQAQKSNGNFVPGEVIVRFRETSAAGKGEASIANLQSENGEQFAINIEPLNHAADVEGLRLARVAPENTMRAVEALRARPDVLYAEPNYRRYKEAVPNDPSYSLLYALKNAGQSGGTVGADIKAEPAWNITTGNRSVVVGVIDEGVDINHPDLVHNIWTNPAEIPGNGIDDDGDGLIDDVHGWDFLNDDNSVYDGSAVSVHGTHVSGIIGAEGNNGVGVVGVNWQVTLLPLKFLGDGGGDDADAIKAILFAKKLRDMWVSSGGTKGANIRVLSNSWGGGGNSLALRDAIQAANDSGILFVAASGNDAVSTDSAPHFPSSYSVANIISVSSTDRFDTQSSFSNYGSNSVHIAAPGSSIYSTMPNNSYGFLSGTSMATPYVSSVAALVCAANPNISLKGLRSVILFGGDVLPSLSDKNLTGSRLNALGALQSATENDTTAPGAIGDLHVTGQSGRLVTLGWTASGEDGNSGTASLYTFSFVDSFTSAETTLGHLHPAAPGTQQSITLKVPYRHTSGAFRMRTFDNVGNEGPQISTPVALSADIADPYTVTETSAQSLSTGGTPLGVNADDRYVENYTLPFSFPFYGIKYSAVTLSSNGSLYFSTPPKRSNGDAGDVPGTVLGLNNQKMIAGLWDDLDLRTCFRTDADIYVVSPDSNRVIFRWQGVSFSSTTCPATPGTTDRINFEIELQRDGHVITRYGSGNLDLNPVVGISAGEPDAYTVLSHTSESAPLNLNNAQTVTFSTIPFCEFALGFMHVVLGPNAQGGNVSVGTLGGCNWAASSNAPWITIVSGAPGSGPGTLRYQVAENPTTSPRTGTVTIAGQTLTISQSAGPAPIQPADDSQFFVREHYLDFLAREPDEDGLGYWTNEITKCGSDLACINSRRVGVSAAFFIEAEFQQTGSFVYRLYKGALGRQPTFAEFSTDRLQVIGGANLDASKVTFANAFVQRQEFITKYQGTGKSSQGFVDLLIATIHDSSGVDITGQRDTLLNLYDSGNDVTESRSLTVRAAIEDAGFKQAVYNPSFVLMQYYGYLHRDPEQDGYLFWLDVLNNREPGNYRGMVCSFITSAEYQLRFGSTVTRTNRDCSSIH
jgi:subtilisin family serine protease